MSNQWGLGNNQVDLRKLGKSLYSIGADIFETDAVEKFIGAPTKRSCGRNYEGKSLYIMNF